MSAGAGHPEPADPSGMDGTKATAGLATRYRRVLAILPRAYREQRGEEMLTTMMENAADAGRDRPALGEWLSVLGLSLRLRSGAPGTNQRARSIGENLRLIALLGLLVQAGAPRQLWSVESAPGLGTLLRHLGVATWGQAALVVCGVLGPCLTMAALLRGWRRLGVVLLTVNSLIFLATFQELFIVGTDTWWENWCAMIVVCVIPLFAGLLGFHRDAPRIRRPLWWSAATFFTGLALLATAYAIVPLADRDLTMDLYQTTWLLSHLFAFAAACLVAVLVLRHARRSGGGPVLLVVGAAPLLLVLPSMMNAVSMWAASPSLRPLTIDLVLGPTDNPYTWIGAYVLAAEVLLAVTLAIPSRRFGATVATTNTAG